MMRQRENMARLGGITDGGSIEDRQALPAFADPGPRSSRIWASYPPVLALKRSPGLLSALADLYPSISQESRDP